MALPIIGAALGVACRVAFKPVTSLLTKFPSLATKVDGLAGKGGLLGELGGFLKTKYLADFFVSSVGINAANKLLTGESKKTPAQQQAASGAPVGAEGASGEIPDQVFKPTDASITPQEAAQLGISGSEMLAPANAAPAATTAGNLQLRSGGGFRA